MNQKCFEALAQEIYESCADMYWYAPNNIKQAQIHVKTWQVPPSTAKLLFSFVKLSRAKTILELGTSVGYSTIWLAQAAKQQGGHVHTIEYFKPKIEVAKEHFAKAELDDVITQHEGHILDVLKTWTNDLDFVFMDADRGNYDTYFYYIYPALKKGGIIIVDNALNYRDRMVRFLKLCGEAPHQFITTIELDAGLFLFIK